MSTTLEEALRMRMIINDQEAREHYLMIMKPTIVEWEKNRFEMKPHVSHILETNPVFWINFYVRLRQAGYINADDKYMEELISKLNRSIRMPPDPTRSWERISGQTSPMWSLESGVHEDEIYYGNAGQMAYGPSVPVGISRGGVDIGELPPTAPIGDAMLYVQQTTPAGSPGQYYHGGTGRAMTSSGSDGIFLAINPRVSFESRTPTDHVQLNIHPSEQTTPAASPQYYPAMTSSGSQTLGRLPGVYVIPSPTEPDHVILDMPPSSAPPRGYPRQLTPTAPSGNVMSFAQQTSPEIYAGDVELGLTSPGRPSGGTVPNVIAFGDGSISTGLGEMYLKVEVLLKNGGAIPAYYAAITSSPSVAVKLTAAFAIVCTVIAFILPGKCMKAKGIFTIVGGFAGGVSVVAAVGNNLSPAFFVPL